MVIKKKKKEEPKFESEALAGVSKPQVIKEVELGAYEVTVEGIPVAVRISKDKDFVPKYEINIPGIGPGTKIVLDDIKNELVTTVRVDIADIVDPRKATEVRKKFEDKAQQLLSTHFPMLSGKTKQVLASYLILYTLELGEIEFPMNDENLEEIVINGAVDPVWVYHKKFGWLKTNIKMPNENDIYNLAAKIGRRIGRQITVLDPLMDAHLVTGDRVNATLFPISNRGNTITIRKFARNPWTITQFIANKTISPEVASIIWLAIQNEMSLLVSGGTASGKTSMLNAIACFFPPNQRIISIEDTRELLLPEFLHWVPMTTRLPNPEGKGEITMLDLLVNSLRMRPDRILVGEIRRQVEAEVLFEAMHTGHSVYATVHADNAEETVNRLTNPPINVPKNLLSAISGIIVCYRHRRLGIRRILEFAEVLKGGNENVIYRWNIKADKTEKIGQYAALLNTLNLYAGMDESEINKDLDGKQKVLEWMVKNKVNTVNDVGRVVAKYYESEDEVYNAIKSGKSPTDLLK